MSKPRYQKRKTPLTGKLTSEQRYHLFRGTGYFGDPFSGDRESMCVAFGTHRQSLTSEFRDRYRTLTFCRPWAWWVLVHRRPRPIVGTWATPDQLATIRQRHTQHGVFHCYLIGPDGESLQQEEAAYLESKNLLTAEEREWLSTDPPAFRIAGKALQLDDDDDLDDDLDQ